MPRERFVAIGLLTDADLRTFGPEFEHAYPLDDKPCFQDLLRAIDEAERRRAGSGEERRRSRPFQLVPGPLGSAALAELPSGRRSS